MLKKKKFFYFFIFLSYYILSLSTNPPNPIKFLHVPPSISFTHTHQPKPLTLLLFSIFFTLFPLCLSPRLPSLSLKQKLIIFLIRSNPNPPHRPLSSITHLTDHRSLASQTHLTDHFSMVDRMTQLVSCWVDLIGTEQHNNNDEKWKWLFDGGEATSMVAALVPGEATTWDFCLVPNSQPECLRVL